VQLASRDAAAAERILPTDTQRVVRALELLDAGHPPPSGDQLWTTDTRVATEMFGLTMERDALYARIDARVDGMWAAGVEQEVGRAAAAGASATARKAVGFEEVLAGDREAMKTRTRRYARRQLTWMRKLPAITTIDVTGREPGEVAAEIVPKVGR
jgi:tRNA dimethylallyltransferase